MDRFERIRPFIKELQNAIRDSLGENNERFREITGRINDAGFELGIAIEIGFQFREHGPEPPAPALPSATADTAVPSAAEAIDDLKFLKEMRIKIE